MLSWYMYRYRQWRRRAWLSVTNAADLWHLACIVNRILYFWKQGLLWIKQNAKDYGIQSCAYFTSHIHQTKRRKCIKQSCNTHRFDTEPPCSPWHTGSGCETGISPCSRTPAHTGTLFLHTPSHINTWSKLNVYAKLQQMINIFQQPQNPSKWHTGLDILPPHSVRWLFQCI